MIDPSEITSGAAFAAALTELREERGMTIRGLSRETGIPSATLGGYFSGRHLPSLSQQEQLATLLRGLGVAEEQLSQWRDALRRVRRAPGPRPTDENPYRGLACYDIDDSDVYFGRDALLAESEQQLEDARVREGNRWVTLVGGSGSGKSSLLRAGLLGRLKAAGQPVAVMVPGDDPEAALDAALAELDGREGSTLGVDQLEEAFSGRVADDVRDRFLRRLVDLSSDSRLVVVASLRADFYHRCVEHPLLLPLMRQHVVLVGPMTDEELRTAIVRPASERGRTVEPALVDLVLEDARPYLAESPVLPLVSQALTLTWERSRPGGQLTAADYVETGRVAGAIQATAESAWDSLDEEGRAAGRALFAHLVTVDPEGVVTRRRLPRHVIATLGSPAGTESVLQAFVACRILVMQADTVEITHEALFDAWPRLREWIADNLGRLRVIARLRQAAYAWDEAGRPDELLARGAMLALVEQVEQVEQVEESIGDGVQLAPLQQEYVAASRAVARLEQDRERAHHRRLVQLVAALAVLALLTTVATAYLAVAVRDARDSRNLAEAVSDAALSRQLALQSQDLAEHSPELARALAVAAYRTDQTVEARSALLETSALPVTTRKLGTPGAMRVVYSPDGTTLAVAGADGRIHFHRRDPDWPTALADEGPVVTARRSADGAGEELFAGAFSPDGSLFAAGGTSGDVTLVDLTDPASPAVRWLSGPQTAVQGLAFSPDGTQLAAATSDPALYRWQLTGTNARALPTVRAFGGSVQSVAFGAGGLVATGSSDGALRLWRPVGSRLRLQRVLRVGPADSAYVLGVDFNDAGTMLAAAVKDGTVRVWHVHGGTVTPATAPLGGFTSQVNAVAFSRDGKLLAGAASGGRTTVWRTDDFGVETSVEGPANFTSVDISPDSRTFATGAIDGTTRVTMVATPTLPSLGGTIWSLTYPEDGTELYAGVGKGGNRVEDVETSRALAPHADGPEYVGPATAPTGGTAAVSPDGRTLVSGTSAGSLLVWRTGSGEDALPEQVLTDDDQVTENVAFSPDGRWFAGISDDGYLSIYQVDAPGRAHLLAHVQTDGLPLGLAFDPTGSIVAVGTADQRVTLYRVSSTPTEVATVEGFRNYVYSVAFSPDGEMLAAGSADHTVRLWNVEDPAHPHEVTDPLTGPQNTLYGLAFTPDGLLAAASSDGAVWVWQVDHQHATSYARLTNLGGAAYQVAADPRGDVIAGGGADGHVSLWSTDVEEVAEQACRTIGTPLTREEWRSLVPGVAYHDPCRES